MPRSALGLLDPDIGQVTIGPMVMKPAEKKDLYFPYVEILKDIRQQEGISQSALAESVGLSSKYVTLVESGKRVPTVECLLALMAEVGVARETAEDLMKEVLDQFEWKG